MTQAKDLLTVHVILSPFLKLTGAKPFIRNGTNHQARTLRRISSTPHRTHIHFTIPKRHLFVTVGVMECSHAAEGIFRWREILRFVGGRDYGFIGETECDDWLLFERGSG